MAKLTLNLDQLAVDTFDTAPAATDRGTVFGEQACTCQTACTCPGCPTCAYTACNEQTCAHTCNVTCGPSWWYTECDSDPTCDPTNTYNGPLCRCCPI